MYRKASPKSGRDACSDKQAAAPIDSHNKSAEAPVYSFANMHSKHLRDPAGNEPPHKHQHRPERGAKDLIMPELCLL